MPQPRRNFASSVFSDEKQRMPLLKKTVSDFRQWRKEVDGPLAIVPTMGALHDGHVALIKLGRQLGKKLAVWIFVNPLQFGPKEDFGSYPRTFDQDVEICSKAGVDAIFCPSVHEIYPHGENECATVVPPPELAAVLEGAFRPAFFTGVATVVTKFFNIMSPDIAMFGEKDYQQLLVVRHLVFDLNLPISIQAVPTVRAQDGLALSSRNAYLNAVQRGAAPLLYNTLKTVESQIRAGQPVEEALQQGRATISTSGQFELQYLEARDSISFAPHDQAQNKLVLLVAAKLEGVRLIDNVIMRD